MKKNTEGYRVLPPRFRMCPVRLTDASIKGGEQHDHDR